MYIAMLTDIKLIIWTFLRKRETEQSRWSVHIYKWTTFMGNIHVPCDKPCIYLCRNAHLHLKFYQTGDLELAV